MRYLAIVAIAVTAACSLKFPDKHEASFACNQDSDCTSPFICKGNKCVDLNGAARCPQPTFTTTSNPTTSQYVGFGYTLSGSATSTDATCPIADVQWLACGAPAASKYATTDNNGCTKLADGTDATFVPDVHGPYNLTLQATAGDAVGTQVVPVTALADTLFVQLSYYDPTVTTQIAIAQLSNDCWSLTQDQCTGGCAWRADYSVCWTNCTPKSTEDTCQENGQCEWDSGTSTCSIQISQQSVCIVQSGDANACAARDKCRYLAAAEACIVTCDQIDSEDSCNQLGCVWDGPTSTCAAGDGAVSNLAPPLSTVAALYTDGSGIAPLQYGGAAVYRYDPNGKFPTARLGNGLDLTSYGIAYDPVKAVALIPHLYMYDTPPVSGVGQCATSQELLLWRQGDVLGQPATGGVQPAFPPTLSNTTPAAPTPYTHTGLPDLTVRDDGSLRIIYTQLVDTASASSCESNGKSTADFAFTIVPLASSLGSGPLNIPEANPLVIGQAGSGGALTRINLQSHQQPCTTTYDCNGGTCTAGHCAADFQAEGYMPRFHAKGQALTYSHEICGSAYGHACDNLDAGTDFDIMLSRVNADTNGTTMSIDKMTLIAADPGVKELDAVIPQDPFGAIGTVYYIGRVDTPLTVTVKDPPYTSTSTITQKIPIYTLFSRTLSYDGSAWSVAPDAHAPGTVVVPGSMTPKTVDFLSCQLDFVSGREIATLASVDYPSQFTFSPDGRYVAFVHVKGDTNCPTLATSDSTNIPIDLRSAVIQYIDIASPDRAVHDLIPPSCTAAQQLGEVSLMPKFVAGGAQVVFNNRAAGGTGFANRFFRMNMADLGSTTCPLVELGATSQATAVLQAIRSDLSSAGVSLVDTRTSYGCISCSSVEGAGSFGIVGIGVLWRLLRRRRTLS
jgi:hypothetical protein